MAVRLFSSGNLLRKALLGIGNVALLALAGAYLLANAGDTHQSAGAGADLAADPDSVSLTDTQSRLIAVDSVAEHAFALQAEAVGSIDFNEDLATPVFSAYPGRIVRLNARLGDTVTRGETLFTIESPDLIQADSTLIAAAGVLDLTTRALERARKLYEVQGIAAKDLQQAVSDQQTAEGACKAARNAVEVFGKSAAEVDRMVKTRTIDPDLVVTSPIAGTITARNAAPGLFVQPGNPPAPYSVADISRVWMNASVAESDMPRVAKGQRIEVTVMAFPGRHFNGQISAVGATVDAQLHRGMVRAEVEDPNHQLLPGMFASFVILTGAPVNAPAVPLDGVVREGDGTMTVWVTTDRHHFTKRIVRIGLQRDGFDQIVDGVHPGEMIVTQGAVFLDNLLSGGLS